MIQRIQSIWLFLAATFVTLSFRFPFYTGTNSQDIPYRQLTGLNSGMVILLLTAIISILSLVTIFYFKKRSLQLKLCFLGIVLEALLVYLYYREVATFIEGAYSLTAALQIGALLFFILSARGIYKDNKLVKDSNRLR